MDLVPDRVRAEMVALEARDEADRVDGTPQALRLRAIRPEVGRFLLTLALAIDARTIVEIGTSGGYSTLWLAVAAGRTGGRVVTFEIDPEKAELANPTFAAAGVASIVELRIEDGGGGLAAFAEGRPWDEPPSAARWGRADLVFLDAEKDDYLRILGPAIAALRPGGLLVADNLTSHAADLAAFREAALADPRLAGLVVPIGRGELVAVRLGA